MFSRFGITFPRRHTIISLINNCSTGRRASTWKEHKNVDKRMNEKFKPHSLNTPMTFKQWKMHAPRLYEKRLRFLMKAGNATKALETLEDMKQQQVDISPVAYNMVISVLVKQKDITRAFKIFNEMKKHALLPTERTYSSLFHGCAIAGSRSLQIFDKIVAEMERHGVTPSTITSNAMIQALALCEEPDRALEIYESMMSSHISVDLHTFSALLMAAMAKTNDDGLKMAVGIWNELQKLEMVPDIYCYNLLLECLKDCSYSDSWLESISKSLSNELPDRSDHYYGYIKLQFAEDFKIKLYIANSGTRRLMVTDVNAIVDTMDKHSVKPNTKTLYLLTLLLPASVASKTTLQILEKYQLKGDLMFFNRLIRIVAVTGGFPMSMEILWSMESKGITANDFTYQAIASCCHGELEATQLLNIIKERSHTPNEFVWGTLCGLAAKAKNYGYLLHLIKEMKTMAYYPNERIVTILDAAASNKKEQHHLSSEHKNYCKHYSSWRREICTS